MGDQTDGSSNAAQSALLETNKRNSGFLSRVSAMFSSTEPQPDLPATTLPPEQPAPGMVNLRRLRVDDVAIPKVEVVAVPEDISKADLVDVFRDSGKSRLPVYDGTLDTPRGFVHLKDFALKYGFNGVGNEFEIAPLLRPLLYVPPSMPIGVLLQKMQTERMHLALVIDEYGGVDGLVSIEDLIEQVVGEIEDEHDVAEGRFWTLEKPGIYLTRARTPLDEFETELGFKLLDGEDEEEIDTLGGLVFMLSGRVPARGEVVQHESGAEFEVVDADPRRIKRLRVRLPADIQKAT